MLIHLAGCQLLKELPDNGAAADDQPEFLVPTGLSSTDQSFFMNTDDFNKMKNGNETLSVEDIAKDKLDLLYALQNGYVGMHFIEKSRFNDVLSKVENIRGPLLRFDFFKKIRKILYALPDNHLTVTTLDGLMPKDVFRRREKILGPVQKYWWKLEMYVIKNQNWHVLTLTEFPFSQEPRWNELYTALNTITSSNGLIVDLRDNSGGFTKSAHYLQQYFRYQKTLKAPSTTHYLNKPLVSILEMNRTNDEFRGHHNAIAYSRLKGGYASLKYALKYSSLFFDSVEELPQSPFSSSEFWQKVKLYLLVDGGCASACERFTENLKDLDNVVTIGKNTAGVFHFGTPGLLFLRKSGLKIFLPSGYTELATKKFIEGKGFEPEYRVNNTDSLVKMFETYLNSKH